jgi:hypothetical protein
MKKIIIITAIILTTLIATAQQAGRVRMAFAGFKCLRETADDILHLDGKADEVFFRFYFTIADSNGNTKLKYSNQSDTYGDNYGPFGNRINAGSAVDLFGNLKGGIKGGDNYSCNNIIGEYDLAGGDVLTVMPTIWEWDPGSGIETTFDATVEGAYSIVNQNASNLSNQRFGTGFNNNNSSQLLGLFLVDGGTFLGVKLFIKVADLLTPKPRPIGVTLNGEYSPKAVLLNANVMQQIASSNFGYGQGVIPVQYNEESLGNSRDHGNYIILLKVEFFPSASTTTAVTTPKSTSTSTNNSNKQTTTGITKNIGGVKMMDATSAFNPANTANSNSLSTSTKIKSTTTRDIPKKRMNNTTSSVIGMWAGTQTNDYGMYPQDIKFELTNNGEYLIKDVNGVVVAKGTYTFLNNTINGTYKLFSSGDTFSFIGTFDSISQKLSCTLGMGSTKTGQGKWVVLKK